VALSHAFATFLERRSRVFSETFDRLASIADPALHIAANAAGCAAQALASFGPRRRGEKKRRCSSEECASQESRNSKRAMWHSVP
jgi:hypothetical protein